MPIEIEVNGKRYPVNYPPDTPLLYVLRDELRYEVRLRGRAVRRMHRAAWRSAAALVPNPGERGCRKTRHNH